MNLRKIIITAAAGSLLAALLAGNPASASTQPALGWTPSATAPALSMGEGQTAGLPASVSLVKWAPPVGNQGNVQSCVTWATAYGAEGLLYRKAGRTSETPFSPMYVYTQVNGGKNVGGTFANSFYVEHWRGVASRSAYSSDSSAYTNWWTKPTAAQHTNAARHKIGSVYSLGTWTAVQAQLAAGYPVMVGMRVPYSFLNSSSWTSHTTFTYADYSRNTNIAGGHAMLVVGYSTTGVVVQNSWGTSWGNGGRATIAWSVVFKLASYGAEAYSMH